MINSLLIDQFALSTTMRNCRWNVTGPQELRLLFVSHDRLLGESMDDIAIRAQAAGEERTAMLARYLSQARAKAFPGAYPRASEVTPELVFGHQMVIDRLHENLEQCMDTRGDMIDRGFLGGLIEQHGKMAAELQAVPRDTNRRRANGLDPRLESPLTSWGAI